MNTVLRKLLACLCSLAAVGCGQASSLPAQALLGADVVSDAGPASGSDADFARASAVHGFQSQGCVKAEPAEGSADAPAPPQGSELTRRVQLQVLVLSADDIGTQTVKAGLREGLVPCAEVDLLDAERPRIDAAFLADWVGPATKRARFQAVVLPSQTPSQLSAAELQALADYEREFGIRQLSSYVYPSASLGLRAPTEAGYEGSLDGKVAQLTAAGKAAGFGYLRGTLSFDDADPKLAETSGYLALPLPLTADAAQGGKLTPLLTMAIAGVADGAGPAAADDSAATSDQGVLIGVYAADGREQMFVTAAMNEFQVHQQALFPGILSWLTYGVHLGAKRNFLSVHVDDIFLPNQRWQRPNDCTKRGGCAGTKISMTQEDVLFLESWQEQHNLKLDLLFNGSGYDHAVASGAFPVGESVIARRDSFRFISHTYNHLYLGCTEDFSVTPFRCKTQANSEISWTSYQDVYDQIAKNQDFARRLGLPVQDNELVTGEHSGLRRTPQEPSDNPGLARALTATGIEWIGSDGSREHGQRRIGSALTSPRYPMNIYYDAATKAETIDEYNYIYSAEADGGSGECEHSSNATCIAPLATDSGFDEYIAPREAQAMLMHMLSNSPLAHFAHQSNLAEERVLYPVLERALERYRALFAQDADVVNARLSELGRELQRQTQWADVYSNVNAYIESGKLRIESTGDAPISTPLTLPRAAELSEQPGDLAAYGGALIGWTEASQVAKSIRLPDSVGYKAR